jgi:hypothetical protein
LYLKDLLKVDCVVYYLRDFLLAQPYFSKHGVRSEPAIIEMADVVTTNSLYLEEYAKKINPCTFYIGRDVKWKNLKLKLPMCRLKF